jgi:hypothetical protein
MSNYEKPDLGIRPVDDVPFSDRNPHHFEVDVDGFVDNGTVAESVDRIQPLEALTRGTAEATGNPETTEVSPEELAKQMEVLSEGVEYLNAPREVAGSRRSVLISAGNPEESGADTLKRKTAIARFKNLEKGSPDAERDRKKIVFGMVSQICDDLSPEFRKLGIGNTPSNERESVSDKKKLIQSVGPDTRWATAMDTENQDQLTRHTIFSKTLSTFPDQVARVAAGKIFGYKNNLEGISPDVVKDVLSKKTKIEALRLEREITISDEEKLLIEKNSEESLAKMKNTIGDIIIAEGELTRIIPTLDGPYGDILMYDEDGRIVPSDKYARDIDINVPKIFKACNSLISKIYNLKIGFEVVGGPHTVRDVYNTIDSIRENMESDANRLEKVLNSKKVYEEKVKDLQNQIDTALLE